MKKFIKGMFKFQRLVTEDTDIQAVGDALSAWADQHDQSLMVYIIDFKPLPHVEYRLAAETTDECQALLHSLKEEASRWGTIEVKFEMKGETK